jgi:predicted amidophosphoribosyltransferase
VSRIRPILDFLDAASEAWLGWRAPPVLRAFEAASWTPDALGTYCGRCGGSIGPGEAVESGCGVCRGGSGIGDGVVRLGHHDGALREWILGIKYAQWAAMGEALGRQLAQQVLAANLITSDAAVVVPMPMPWQRRLYRGIDHARVIAGAVANALNAPMVPCLAKSNGPPMVALTASERQASGGRGMHVAKRWGGWVLSDLDALIVDDVWTTGASLRAAVRLLRTLGARSVVAAVLAVADDSGRQTAARGPDSRKNPVQVLEIADSGGLRSF